MLSGLTDGFSRWQSELLHHVRGIVFFALSVLDAFVHAITSAMGLLVVTFAPPRIS